MNAEQSGQPEPPITWGLGFEAFWRRPGYRMRYRTEMLDELAILRERYRRSKTDPHMLRAQLAATGAQVLELRPIARITPMPFHGLRPLPAFYEIRSTFNGRHGRWYVRTASDAAPPEWLWHDADGYDSSPLPDLGPSVGGEPIAVSWVHDWMLVGMAVLVVVPIATWFFM